MPSRTILVVDDEEHVRSALTRVLEREGYVVRAAEGPTEALEILRTETFKLVISDHNMPDMTGIEFFKLLRERHPDICRVMLTADPERETVIRSINEGEVHRFIAKPWDNIQLRVTVHFAFEAIQLQEENRRLAAALRRQLRFVRGLEKSFPYLAALAKQEEAELLQVNMGTEPESS